MISNAVRDLVLYGMENGLVDAQDEIYVTNRIISHLKLVDFDEDVKAVKRPLKEILDEILDYATKKVIIDGGIGSRDIFDTTLMGEMVMPPSVITKNFFKDYEESPRKATDNYYKLSKASDYIREYRIVKDKKWEADTEFGKLDITINLSKPEKDPKAIAAALTATDKKYPKCLLCPENVGYMGTLTHPSRVNHRIIPLKLNNEDWSFQYSPYVYYNEHCIVFNNKHIPMKIDKSTFVKLFDFVKMFPHYFVGSNADLPIVGGSILTHEHFQGGCYTFPMERAEIKEELTVKGFEDVKAGIVDWPMSVIRLNHPDEKRLIEAGDCILKAWREYTDESAFIFAYTDGVPHNTITPIARKRGDNYELDLVLRNNITTKEHPLGVYHPHSELHHIKKENIGLIEVMGLAVLPARLDKEMAMLADYLVNNKDIRSDETLKCHADWADELKDKYREFSKDSVDDILKKEIGIVFGRVLKDAGVLDAQGIKRFVAAI